jgi:hypothetical protein
MPSTDRPRAEQADDRAIVGRGEIDVVGDDELLERRPQVTLHLAVDVEPERIVEREHHHVRRDPRLDGEQQRRTRPARRERRHVVGQHPLQELDAILARRDDHRP